jgi:hypothetical protein
LRTRNNRSNTPSLREVEVRWRTARHYLRTLLLTRSQRSKPVNFLERSCRHVDLRSGQRIDESARVETKTVRFARRRSCAAVGGLVAGEGRGEARPRRRIASGRRRRSEGTGSTARRSSSPHWIAAFYRREAPRDERGRHERLKHPFEKTPTLFQLLATARSRRMGAWISDRLGNGDHSSHHGQEGGAGGWADALRLAAGTSAADEA